MITTASFTQYWKKGRAELASCLALSLLALAFLLALAPLNNAFAQANVELTQIRLERADDAVYLSANVDFELPAIVEDALLKGLPMHFVAEADLYRDRWYWYDRKVATATRYMRLAYQPLTRRWRLAISSSPITNTGLGLSLGQTFENLPDALNAIQRISRWKIAEASDVEPDSRHNVEFRFRLDTTQLPRPLQIGVVGQGEWNISTSRNLRLQVESAR